jgi:hypothetical protein
MATKPWQRGGVLSNPKGLDYVRFASKTDGSRIRLVMHCGTAGTGWTSCHICFCQSAVVTLRQLHVAAIFAQARTCSRERRQHIAPGTTPSRSFWPQSVSPLTIQPSFNGFERSPVYFRAALLSTGQRVKL